MDMQFGSPRTPEGPGPDARQVEDRAENGGKGGQEESRAEHAGDTTARASRTLMAMVGLVISAVGLWHAGGLAGLVMLIGTAAPT
eukprot:5731821-Alexandrium_andersonii.AAC.1